MRLSNIWMMVPETVQNLPLIFSHHERYSTTTWDIASWLPTLTFIPRFPKQCHVVLLWGSIGWCFLLLLIDLADLPDSLGPGGAKKKSWTLRHQTIFETTKNPSEHMDFTRKAMDFLGFLMGSPINITQAHPRTLKTAIPPQKKSYSKNPYSKYL